MLYVFVQWYFRLFGVLGRECALGGTFASCENGKGVVCEMEIAFLRNLFRWSGVRDFIAARYGSACVLRAVRDSHCGGIFGALWGVGARFELEISQLTMAKRNGGGQTGDFHDACARRRLGDRALAHRRVFLVWEVFARLGIRAYLSCGVYGSVYVAYALG